MKLPILTGLITALPLMAFAEMLQLNIDGATQGTIKIDLAETTAPKHVERIKQLVKEGAYDNVAFHRVIDGFMAQTGDVQFGKMDGYDPNMAGRGGSSEPDLEAEFSDGNFARGVVGMARAMDPNSANSQFFIMFADASHLNGQYTIIGTVSEGMDVVDALAKGDVATNGTVTSPDYIKTASIEE